MLVPALVVLALAAGCGGQRGPLQSQRSGFTALDADGDGWLLPGEIDPASPLSQAFARWDQDNDGRVDWREFLRYKGHHPRERPPARARFSPPVQHGGQDTPVREPP